MRYGNRTYRLTPTAFIPVDATFVGMLIGGIDLMMLLSDFFEARREKRIAAAAEAAAEAARAEERDLWINWNNRCLAAEARGEEFTEPPPGQSTEKTRQNKQ